MNEFTNGDRQKSKRKTLFFIIAVCLLVITGCGIFLYSTFSNKEIEGSNKNIKIVKRIKGDIASAPDYTKKDGILTEDDSDLILKFSVNLYTPTAIQKKNADVDGDGNISSADARLVLRAVYGYYDYNKDGEVDSKDVNYLSKNSKSSSDIAIVKRLAAGYGDVATAPQYAKSDGIITKDDVQAFSKIIEDAEPVSTDKAKTIDLNNDGKFDGSDLYVLSKKVDFSEGEDADSESASDIQKALAETAYAFLNRGNTIQYDSFRRMNYLKPEDATIYNTGFTVCSGFTFQAYYNALDISAINYYDKKGNKKTGVPLYVADILDFALQEKNKSKVVFKYDKDYLYGSNTGYSDFSNFYKNIESKLKIGDIIVYTTGSASSLDSGHAQMYVGDGLMMESHTPEEARKNKKWAARYNYAYSRDVYEEYGTITLYNLKQRIKSGMSKTGNDRLSYLVAIRPYVGDNVKITDSAKLRLEFPGLKITKTAEILDANNKVIKSQNATISPGEKIKYSITIENTSDNDYSKTLKIEEKYPINTFSLNNYSNLSYEKGTGVLSGKAVNIKKNSKATFSYVLKLKDNATLNSVVSTSGKVYSDKNTNGITTSNVETFVSKSLNETQKTDLLSSAKIKTDFPGITVTKSAEILDSNNKAITSQVGIVTTGNRVRYTITVENTGDKDYKEDILLEEKYSTSVFSLKDYKGLSYAKGTGVLSGKISTMKKGSKKTFTYIVEATSSNKDNSFISTSGKVYSNSNRLGMETEKINLKYVKSISSTSNKNSKFTTEFPGLKVTKSVEIYYGKSNKLKPDNGKVNIGDRVKYKIVVENTSNKNYTATLKVEEKYSTGVFSLQSNSGLSYAKGTGVLSGSIQNLQKGMKKELSYVLIVRDTAKENSIISTSGKVYSDKNASGIETNKIELLVSKNESLDSSGLAFVKNIYSSSNVSEKIKSSVNKIPNSFSELIKVVIKDNANSVNGIKSYKIKVNTDYSKMIVGNFYGARIGHATGGQTLPADVVDGFSAWSLSTKTPKMNRTRELRPDMLESGDIVYVKTKDSDGNDSEKAYIYIVSNKEGYLYRKYYYNNDIIEEIYSPTNYEKRVLNRNTVEITKSDSTNITRYLRDLVGNNFVVLKPSNLN